MKRQKKHSLKTKQSLDAKTRTRFRYDVEYSNYLTENWK